MFILWLLQFFAFWHLFLPFVISRRQHFHFYQVLSLSVESWHWLGRYWGWLGPERDQLWACSPKQSLVGVFPLSVPPCLLPDFYCSLCPAVSKNNFLSSPTHWKNLCTVWQGSGVSKLRGLLSFPGSSSFSDCNDTNSVPASLWRGEPDGCFASMITFWCKWWRNQQGKARCWTLC